MMLRTSTEMRWMEELTSLMLSMGKILMKTSMKMLILVLEICNRNWPSRWKRTSCKTQLSSLMSQKKNGKSRLRK